MGLYLYGVMRAADCPRGLDPDEPGSRAAVRAVRHDALCALVTEAPDGALQVRKDNLLAHTDVLRRALEHGPVLPLRFGVVMPDEVTIADELLRPQATELMARLHAFEDKAEMQVKATYLEEPLLRSVLAADPAVSKLADRVRRVSAEAGHFDRIRLGEMIAGAVQARRGVASRELTDRLRPLAVAVSVGQPQHERMALNAAFLVERARLGEFDAAVEQLSQERSDEMQFRLIGPLAPHSFADDGSDRSAVAWA